MRKMLTSRIALHLYFWIAVFVFFSLAPMIERGQWSPNLTAVTLMLVLAIPPVYAHFFLFTTFFSSRRYILYAVFLVAVVVTHSFIVRSAFFMAMGHKVSLLGLGSTMIIFIAGTTALKLVRGDIRNRMQLQELKTKQLQTELHLLKSQINPHFLFNTLNNLFSMARRQNPNTADGIVHLSHLMRYMIYDCTAERIGLDKEVQQIHRIIELQKLRFAEGDPIQIDFQIDGDPTSVRIPPMILIPFVENAFKHGISIRAPSFIEIRLTVTGKQMEFSIRNSIHPAVTAKGNSQNGVGLQNVKRQLEILFPGTHELLVQREGDAFVVVLTIRSLQ